MREVLTDASALCRVGTPLNAAFGPCAVAVAGSRESRAKLAREIGRRLAEAGTVTGFSCGVDEEASFGALEAGGRVAAVLPCGRLNPRAALLLCVAAARRAPASAAAENLAKDERRVGAWPAARNRIVVNIASALVAPEAKFKPTRWGTRHAAERALKTGRLVVALKPRPGDAGVLEAFNYFTRLGAVAAEGRRSPQHD